MQKNILVIDDNSHIRENIAEILELANYNVITAENGKEGVAIAQEELPDIIICDIMMPELDGYGVLYLLSKNPVTSNIPFIFLTAKAEMDDLRKGMNLGADDYLTKPFEETDLLNAIETRIKRNESFKSIEDNSPENVNTFFNEAKGTAALEQLSESRKTKQYNKKEMIYLEDNYPHALFYIVDGKVKTYKTNEDGKELITGVFSKGDFIGYLPLLQDCEYQDSAMAMEKSTINVISKADFNQLVHTNKDVSMKFIKMLSGNIMDKESELLKYAYNTVRKRVADSLLKIGKKYLNENQDLFALSREDLANMVGTAPESVIRVLSEFKEDKIIETEGRKIRILDIESLSNIQY